MKRTRSTSIATALLLATVTTGVAGAQTVQDTAGVTVTTEVGEHERMLDVTDVAGGPLTGITLVPGRPSPFRVAVTDSSPAAVDLGWSLGGYTVDSSMTNLYATDGGTPDYAASIASGDISLGYATTPLEIKDALAKVQPSYVLSATNVTCEAVNGVVPGLVDLLDATLCTLTGTLAGDGLSFTGVPLEAAGLTQVDLSALDHASLPLIPRTGGNAGATYAEADCANGVGAGAGAGCTTGEGTKLTMLTATTDHDAAGLTALGTALTDGLPVDLASLTGADAMASLDEVLAALTAAGGDAALLVGVLDDFTPEQQVQLVNGLIDATTGALGLGDLLGYGVLAASYPTLQVDPSTAGAGTYAGTLTVRLIDCPAC